jgi:hypothetical protein
MANPKIILDLCGGTGAWPKPYKDAGHDVRVVTLPDNDVRTYTPPDNVYGVLAAPPCTAFSMMRNFWGGMNNHQKGEAAAKQRTLQGLEIVSACMRTILTAEPTFWALENPKGYLRRWLGLPTHTFEPWYFGENYPKRTDLWGKFNIPVQLYTEKPKGLVKFAHILSKDIHPEYLGKLTRQERRAITPAGFAKAFFEANQ